MTIQTGSYTISNENTDEDMNEWIIKPITFMDLFKQSPNVTV